MKKLLIIMVLAGATPFLHAAPVQDSGPTHTETLTLSFRAPFLQPVEAPLNQRWEEMSLGPISWTASDTGTVPAQMWGLNTAIEVKTTTVRREDIASVFINPIGEGGSPQLWDAWRHRHGYLFIPGLGYFWNSLEDVKERMSDADGALYDRFLKSVWSYWAVKTLAARLGKTDNAPPSIPAQNPPDFQEAIRVSYNAGGLVKPAECAFRISVWNTPVLITFEARPSTAAVNGTLVEFKYRWTYDLGEWRGRHGYKKDLWGYGWQRDFPDTEQLTEDLGSRLDTLLDRTISYWVDVAAQQMQTDFENEFFAAMNREFGDAPPPEGGG